jgi:protocatechuate 3,4-dioxygenase beta subunit
MLTRRDVLRMSMMSLLGSAGFLAMHRIARAQGLGAFTTPSVPCGDVKPTPATPDDATFKAGAPLKASLAEAGMTGERLVLTGTVSGVICGAIKGARVDIWQADAQGVYDAKGFRLRGHVLSDAQGVYRIETVMPSAYARRARHLNARITAAGKPTLVTQLFIADDPLNARDPQFKPELAIKPTKTPAGWLGNFAFVLNA